MEFKEAMILRYGGRMVRRKCWSDGVFLDKGNLWHERTNGEIVHDAVDWCFEKGIENTNDWEEYNLKYTKNKSIEFPSVHSDERRSIFANTDLLNGKEISIIKLNKGRAIGGCIHNKDEYYAIISGSVVIIKGVENTIGLPGDAGTFEAGIPHAFYCQEDSVIMEWGLTPEEKHKDLKSPELLNRVKELNLIK